MEDINFLRTAVFWFDSIIYPLIGKAYNLLTSIANTTIFSEEIIDMFSSKVYALLGIFMLFKVSFSILTYIVNPDEFSDKTKGFTKMISNIVITLVLLLFTPWLFSQAMDIQRIVLKDNVIGKIFSTTENSTTSVINAGDTMAFETLKTFYYLDTNTAESYSCRGLQEGKEIVNEAECKIYIGKNYETYKGLLEGANTSKSVSLYMNYDLLNLKSSKTDEYVMQYTPVVSTIAGGFICWILFMFCFDIAVRSVKFGFLRLIAPVPIISRIDPKKGQDMFNKWVKSCISTYLDLFMRLLAISFAVFIITQITSLDYTNAATGLSTEVNGYVKVFIIIGTLLFAKQLPKLLEELTGIKLDGKFTLNPFKKLSEVPAVGKLSHTAIGAVDSKLHGNGFWNGVRRNWKDVAWMGGDGKTSILETSDRKMRREIREKRDYAKQRYQGIEATDRLNDQIQLGTDKLSEINAASEAAGKRAYDTAIRNGQSEADAEKARDKAASAAKEAKERALYGEKYYQSKKNVDDAKKNMYAWETQVDSAKQIYDTAYARYGKGSAEERAAYEQYEKAKTLAGSARGQYEYRNAQHKNLKDQMPEKAKIEDAIEASEKMGMSKFTSAKGYVLRDYAGINDDTSTTPINQSPSPQSQNDSNDRIDELRQKEEETRIEMNAKSQKVSATFAEYIKVNGDPSISEERKIQVYEEYKNAKNEQEEAIAEHDRVVRELNEAVVEQSEDNENQATDQNRDAADDIIEQDTSEENNSEPENTEDEENQEELEKQKLIQEYKNQEAKVEEAKRFMEAKEKEFAKAYEDYIKVMSNPLNYPEKTKTQIYDTYKKLTDEREKAIFEYERAKNLLREIAIKLNLIGDSEE